MSTNFADFTKNALAGFPLSGFSNADFPKRTCANFLRKSKDGELLMAVARICLNTGVWRRTKSSMSLRSVSTAGPLG